MTINEVLVPKKLVKFLEARNLLGQFRKAVNYIKSGKFETVKLKIRQPKKDRIYYFRINKQYRAFGYLDGDKFKIFKIDDHQN